MENLHGNVHVYVLKMHKNCIYSLFRASFWFSLQYVYMYMCDGYSGIIAAPRSFSSLAFCSNEYRL